MLEQHPTQYEEPSRFHVLCAEVEEYDHLPSPPHDPEHPARFITGHDHEADLDAEILAGLVSP
jgi:hypothetical protein